MTTLRGDRTSSLFGKATSSLFLTLSTRHGATDSDITNQLQGQTQCNTSPAHDKTIFTQMEEREKERKEDLGRGENVCCGFHGLQQRLNVDAGIRQSHAVNDGSTTMLERLTVQRAI